MGCRKALWPDTAIAHKCDEKEPDSTVIYSKAPLSQFLEKRNETEWLSFYNGLMFLCVWWGQPEAPHLEGHDF